MIIFITYKHFLKKFSEGISRRHPLYILTRTMAILVRTHRSVQEALGTPEGKPSSGS